MRVAFISAECEPWAKTGGLGDVADALARALSRAPSRATALDGPVEVFLPRYRGVEVPADATSRALRVADPTAVGGVTQLRLVEFSAGGYRLRLLDHPPAFDREGFYGDASGDYHDNGWRFGLMCRAALEALRRDGRPVDVIHLHDWEAAPAAILRDGAYAADPVISRAAMILTLHNLSYQGWLNREQAAGLASPEEWRRAGRSPDDGVLLLREGIERAELVNTVSPGYAKEAVTPPFGNGLDGVLAGLGDRFGGILNGLDTAVWDPATDGALPARYSRTRMAGKAACRRALLSELGFDPADAGPVLGLVGRLDPQKGFDLLSGAAHELVDLGARIVVLGTGDHWLVRDLAGFATRRPESVAVVEAFDRDLARRIYAGSDLFLMPSRFEPCGQGQMIAMRYGTPPIVHRTGGLADTVVDADEQPDDGNGFVFEGLSSRAFLDACRRGTDRYRAGGKPWTSLVDRGMSIDWSWDAGPAEQYTAAYERAVSIRRGRLAGDAGAP